MTFLKMNRNVIIGLLVVGVGALFAYRFVPTLGQKNNNVVPRATNESAAITREVSAIASYKVPDGTDKVRFTLGLDAGGAVVAVIATNALKGDATDENLKKFSNGLLLVIRGKLLSELTAVDRVGKSSLTTAAFNAVLPDLKKQL